VGKKESPCFGKLSSVNIVVIELSSPGNIGFDSNLVAISLIVEDGREAKHLEIAF
jgi:hypothetical protein